MSIDLMGYRPGPFGCLAARLFDRANALELELPRLDDPLEPIISVLWHGLNGEPFKSTPHQCKDLGEKRSMVAFTGGKDSIAVALKERAAGREVHLFHVRGINPAYPGELDHAKNVASALGMPLAVLRVNPGRQEHIENPAKNAAILGLMIDVGLKQGIKRYALGTQYDDHAGLIAYGAGFSDTIELMDAAAWTFGSMAELEIETRALRNEAESYSILAKAGLWDLAGSCMATPRFRESLHKRNKAKFGDCIRPGRCGSCYKCAQELLYGRALRVINPSNSAINHAIGVLVKNAERVFGPAANGWSVSKTVDAFVNLGDLAHG